MESEKCYKPGLSFPQSPLLNIEQYTSALANTQKCALLTTPNLRKRMAEGKSRRKVAVILCDCS